MSTDKNKTQNLMSSDHHIQIEIIESHLEWFKQQLQAEGIEVNECVIQLVKTVVDSVYIEGVNVGKLTNGKTQ